jgi:hypothetical protein
MRKETITFTDYYGEKRTEDFYFNIDEGELVHMELSQEGGMENFIEKIVNERDRKKMVDLMCNLIEMSYGVRTLDGGFEKSPEAFKKFKSLPAYSKLFTKLATDADYAAVFVNDVMPKPEPDEGPLDRNKSAVEAAKEAARAKLQSINGGNTATPGV